MKTITVQSTKDLDEIEKCLSRHRAVGSSTEHNQSSRSHAIFKLEIVNQTILDALDKIDKAEAIKPALQTKYAQTRSREVKKKIDEVRRNIRKEYRKVNSLLRERGSALGGRMTLVDLAGSDRYLVFWDLALLLYLSRPLQ